MDLLYSFSFKKGLLVLSILLFFLTITTKQTHALSFSSASATLTTSRPSASSPFSSVGAVSDSVLNIFNNGSRFLASDSAKVVRAAGTSNTGLNVASQSADLLKVFLTNSLTTLAGAGADILVVPVTAMHQLGFTPNSPIPSGGKIIISYPGTFQNSASPSATTFSFNNLVSGNVKCFPTTACSGSITISSSGIPTLTLVTGAIQPAGTAITVFIGCSAITGSACTTQVPTLINPTKTNSTAAGADIWRLGIASTDASNNPIDNSTIAIGTIESVTVRATIDPSLTFIISGVTDGQAVNSGNTTGCLQVETTNTGVTSTATDVGLGSLASVPSAGTKLNNIAAQLLDVRTNGANGYSITATSSGPLINPSTGFFVNSSTTPLVFPATGHFFGMHPCGADVDRINWIQGSSSQLCNTYVPGANPVCKYAWPNTAPMLVAQRSAGPIGTGASCASGGCGLTSVSYAATQDVSLPPGIYQSVITYVATPSF